MQPAERHPLAMIHLKHLIFNPYIGGILDVTWVGDDYAPLLNHSGSQFIHNKFGKVRKFLAVRPHPPLLGLIKCI